MSITGRLVLGSILLVAMATVAAIIHGQHRASHVLRDNLRQTLEREASLVRDALPIDSAALQAAVERLGRQAGRRITVIARDGRVVAESDEPSDIVPNIGSHGDRPEILAALDGRTGISTRHSATINQDLLYVAIPGGPGAIRLASPVDTPDGLVASMNRAMLRGAVFPLVLAVLLAFLLARTIVNPVQGATLAVRAVAAEQAPRFPRTSVSDIDALVRALRDMHETLEGRLSVLRHERAETAALVEAMVEGVIAADARGQVVTANAAARRMLGYDEGEPLPALPQLFRAKAAREAVTAASQGEAVVERELDLGGHNVLMSARPLPTGGALLVLDDVSALRRLETVRRDFVANVSHELKTPLTSISGYAETLVSDHADPDTTQRFLEVILANSRRMQELVDALLDLSRIESGAWRPKPVPVDAGAVGRESWALLDSRGKSELQFSTEIEPGAERVYADPDALRHVLTNLLDNASRYVAPGGRITLRARREGEGVRISVRDTGSGIAAEHLPRIFERFYRADSSRSRDMGGTGLGLAIVKHLVEGHDGHVEATSQLGSGTEIACWFPDPASTASVT
ncbi:MAG TPA: ATP-binding protein [Gemmatimonadales bacterium]|nr:ATP-binding protein [Gemmatimonadales bacterium]